MTVVDPPVAEPPAAPQPVAAKKAGWFKTHFNPKKLINGVAGKALEAADVVLDSIPIAEVASEIKDVVLIAIKD